MGYSNFNEGYVGVWRPAAETDNYNLVAQALNTSKPIPYSKTGVWEETCENVADALGQIDSTFKRKPFLKTCGV